MIIYTIMLCALQYVLFVDISTSLQNQYYSINRFFLLIKQSKKWVFKLAVILLYIPLIEINPFLCFWFCLYFVSFNKEKLVVTKRIIRHFIIFSVLLFVNFLLLVFFSLNKYVYLSFFYNIALYWMSFAISCLIEKLLQIRNIKKAKNKLKQYKPIIIGVTGSYGKTSCKNYLNTLLSSSFNVLMTPKSYNTLNGILLTINKQLAPYHEILIIEIGVDKPNGMNKFVKHFSFDIGVVTCIGKQHLKTFGSFEKIVIEKNKLLQKCKKFAIVNLDDKNVNINNNKCEILSFSRLTNDADVLVNQAERNNLLIKIINNTYIVESNIIGKHNLSNLACSICVAKALNIEDDKIIKLIPKIKNVDHRLSLSKRGNWIILDDSYNSNYAGFKNALEELSKIENHIKIIITPGIIEKNKSTEKEELLIANMMNEICDLIILINDPSFKKYIKNFLSFNDFLSAYSYLKENYSNDKIALLIENDLPKIFLR